MWNMDEPEEGYRDGNQSDEQQQNLQASLRNGHTFGQEGETGILRRSESTSQPTFCEAFCAFRKCHLVIVIIILIFSHGLFFYLGTLVPSNCQEDENKCPLAWIGHQGHCYRFSKEEKNWTESQNACISLGASLAKITDGEMDIVENLINKNIFWIGLKREPDQPWKWLDGENSTLKVLGNGGDCAFLDDGATASSARCSTEHRYLCKKNYPTRS
ncbi:C-type lectin domain family 2 member D-like [Python bivittatus]|uniref:C-type lectin domain family 2 member D-like n=1 Tax=Python bivittatus TaxID=176946 RepID=A0A9F5N7C9_PYTBI|nr:C-type lectin domain family 2 member D-like [Python bivittatus]